MTDNHDFIVRELIALAEAKAAEISNNSSRDECDRIVAEHSAIYDRIDALRAVKAPAPTTAPRAVGHSSPAFEPSAGWHPPMGR